MNPAGNVKVTIRLFLTEIQAACSLRIVGAYMPCSRVPYLLFVACWKYDHSNIGVCNTMQTTKACVDLLENLHIYIIEIR